ncbi:hypothetical protein C9W97_26205 [Salmonella enterica subsp. enterica serovar Enteritidis]|nr:hypothetical protein [Salmonella enterica subsp. enterica serovar Enteritidis]
MFKCCPDRLGAPGPKRTAGGQQAHALMAAPQEGQGAFVHQLHQIGQEIRVVDQVVVVELVDAIVFVDAVLETADAPSRIVLVEGTFASSGPSRPILMLHETPSRPFWICA